MLDTPESLAALDDVGASFEQLGRSLRRFAAANRKRTEKAKASVGSIEEAAVGRLWARLGPLNQGFLYKAAAQFEPGETFTLKELAEALDEPKGSIRARIMNLGRSLRSLGPNGPDLWDVDWDDEARENVYEWNYEAHVAVRRMVEG